MFVSSHCFPKFSKIKTQFPEFVEHTGFETAKLGQGELLCTPIKL